MAAQQAMAATVGMKARAAGSDRGSRGSSRSESEQHEN